MSLKLTPRDFLTRILQTFGSYAFEGMKLEVASYLRSFEENPAYLGRLWVALVDSHAYPRPPSRADLVALRGGILEAMDRERRETPALEAPAPTEEERAFALSILDLIKRTAAARSAGPKGRS